jgi:hypothetical protein
MRGSFGPKLWNHFDDITTKLPLTTNHAEGNNEKMHQYNEADHPDIDKCAVLFRVYENTANTSNVNAKKFDALGPKTRLPDSLREDMLRGYQRAHRKWITTKGQVGSNLETYKDDILYHYAYTPQKYQVVATQLLVPRNLATLPTNPRVAKGKVRCNICNCEQ